MTASEIRGNLHLLNESELSELNRAVCRQLKSVRDRECRQKRHMFSSGDVVSFDGRQGYTEGTVVLVKRKKAIVRVNAGSMRMVNWDVPLNMLSLVEG